MTGWIGISTGDVTGIGPEVTLKALSRLEPHDTTRFLLLGDETLFRDLNERWQIGLKLQAFRNYDEPGRFFLLNPHQPVPAGLSPGASPAANAAVAWLKDAALRCLRGELDAMVTAPVSKEAILRAGHHFVGQTEFLSALAGTDRTAMMLLGHDERDRWLRVVLATTHVPVKRISECLTQDKIELAIDRAVDACRLLGLPRRRVAVCGLNPHAGEGGKLGTEEIDVIQPAVAAARTRHPDIEGPFAADALFYYVLQGDYDAVVAMYHDQGLAPLKMIGFETGINWTVGLPFIRTSPDHGTAYGIAGTGTANPSSMLAAIRLARQLACTSDH